MSLQRSCPFLGVLDSDSIRVEWEGQPRPVRLMDVNPERAAPAGAKSATEFGRRTLRWARETYFEDVGEVLLHFSLDKVMLSNSGKLLCYVFVRGENYNVRLVREGWSPCFEKYGYPLIHRAEMERAEFWARLEGRGIWGGLGGRGDYRVLKSHWQRRAGLVDCHRLASTMGEDIFSCRLHYDEIVGRARAGASATVFAELTRSFHLSDGAVLIQLGNPFQPCTAYFPPETRDLAGFIEREFLGFGNANYAYLTGHLALAEGRPQIVIDVPDQITTYPPCAHVIA
ncbi:MAG: thermonuclease family protein [Planctomycetota bacterium]